MKKWLVLLILIPLLLSSCTRKQEEKGPELILRYADNQPDYYPTTIAAEYFASIVKDKSNGKIEIEVYPNAALGDELDTFRQLEFNGIDFMRISVGTLAAFHPDFSILQLPYLFRNSEHMLRVLDGEIGDQFLAQIGEAGITGLCWFNAGARNLYTRTRIDSIDDLKGMLIRTQENEELSKIISLLGADTIQIPYSSVYSELMKGNIDGAENNYPSYMHTGHYEVAPYVFEDEHMRLPEIMVMSAKAKELISALGEEYYAIILDAAQEAAWYERKLWEDEEEKMRREAMKKGVTITTPDEEEKKRWISSMSAIYDSLSEEDQTLIAIMQKL